MLLLYYLFLHAYVSISYGLSSGDSPVLVTRLPDGVTISGSEPLRQIVATWDIYITLEPPPRPEDLEMRLDALSATFESIKSLETTGMTVDLTPFQLRRDHLKRIVMQKPPTPRTRRGLLDVGGTILHHVFGLATDAQLARYRAAMTEVAGRQEVISHAHNALASVVNQTRSYVRQMAVQFKHIRQQIIRLDTAVLTLSRAVQSNTKKLHLIAMKTNLDRYLDILELAASQYQEQVRLFEDQKSGLDHGLLSRNLLTEDQLYEILQSAAAQHKVINDVSWYYRFLSVTPLWRKQSSLLYKIELPLIAPRPYLMYSVLAHPVPLDNSTKFVTLQLEKMYAMDTVSGNLVAPSRCLGSGPILCVTGPEYSPSRMTCARGLLTNRPGLVSSCRATIQDLGPGPIITTIALNQYAIATQGESIMVRCPGAPAHHIQLSRGTHNVTCIRPCTLAGSGFQITCVDRLYLSRHYVMQAVRVTAHFNFTSRVNLEALQSALPRIQNLDTPMTDLPVDTILHPIPPVSQPLPPISHRPSLLTVINVICLAIIIATFSFVYLRWRFIHRRRQATLEPTLHAEALPLNGITSTPLNGNGQDAPHAQPQTTPNAPSCIWPVLPTVMNCANNNSS